MRMFVLAKLVFESGLEFGLGWVGLGWVGFRLCMRVESIYHQETKRYKNNSCLHPSKLGYRIIFFKITGYWVGYHDGALVIQRGDASRGVRLVL